MFKISLYEKLEQYDWIYYNATIYIDEFKENFISDCSFYNYNAYYLSWLQTIDTLFKNGKSYFLTSVGEPQKSNFYFGWPIYLEGDCIYIQNSIFSSQIYNLREVLEVKSTLIDKLSFFNEYGEKLSTWKTNKNSILIFKEELNKALNNL